MDTRTAQELHDDSERLDALVRFVPATKLREALQRQLRQALADPRVDQMVASIARTGLLDRGALNALRGTGIGGPGFEDEVRTAALELTKYWVTYLLRAWRRWGVQHGELALRDNFEPAGLSDAETKEARESLLASSKRSLDALLSSVPLTEHDVAQILSELRDAVKSELKQEAGGIPLPDGVVLVRKHGSVFLQARP